MLFYPPHSTVNPLVDFVDIFGYDEFDCCRKQTNEKKRSIGMDRWIFFFRLLKLCSRHGKIRRGSSSTDGKWKTILRTRQKEVEGLAYFCPFFVNNEELSTVVYNILSAFSLFLLLFPFTISLCVPKAFFFVLCG